MCKRNVELKKYCEIKLQIKQLEAEAAKLFDTAASQFQKIDDKPKFTFEGVGICDVSKASPRKNFGPHYPVEFVQEQAKFKALKEVVEAKLLKEGKVSYTKDPVFSVKVTLAN